MKGFQLLAGLCAARQVYSQAVAEGHPSWYADANGAPGAKGIPDPTYSGEINTIAIPKFNEAQDTASADKAKCVADIPTFTWIDSNSKIPLIKPLLQAVKDQTATTGEKKMAQLVVYNLPNRDCGAEASAGELLIANNGIEEYKKFIDAVAEALTGSEELVSVVLEPDSLGNLVTNQETTDKCKEVVATNAYTIGTLYAIDKLNLPNPPNVRGVATNTANYNAFSIVEAPAYTADSPTKDEKTYINFLAGNLTEQGFPAHFIVDTGRNGVQPTKQEKWGDWCNVLGTGFGVRPTAKQEEIADPLIDAFVWVKPAQSDGTSDQASPRFDPTCGRPAAMQPAPEAGTFFQPYFEQLLANANPPIACDAAAGTQTQVTANDTEGTVPGAVPGTTPEVTPTVDTPIEGIGGLVGGVAGTGLGAGVAAANEVGSGLGLDVGVARADSTTNTQVPDNAGGEGADDECPAA
ncbi:MAG: hypothetical protein M1833_001819 [Piccolia ochrophora]|nr:MAG: hypothetical protein M1833_001819 [Piccolia ochrophora]